MKCLPINTGSMIITTAPSTHLFNLMLIKLKTENSHISATCVYVLLPPKKSEVFNRYMFINILTFVHCYYRAHCI